MDRQNGTISITGGPYVLSSPECPSLLLRKQQEFFDQFEATLEFDPTEERSEAGVVLWSNMYSHVSVGLQVRENTRALVMSKRLHPAQSSETVLEPNASRTVTLRIICSPKSYTISILSENGESAEVAQVEAEDLLQGPPLGGMFTGVMFGLYCTGDQEPCLTPAHFSKIKHLISSTP